MRIAVITGASSGLGKEFALLVDKTEKNVDEIWLIARRRARLEEVAGQLVHPSCVLPLDLALPESIDRLEAELRRRDSMETSGRAYKKNDKDLKQEPKVEPYREELRNRISGQQEKTGGNSRERDSKWEPHRGNVADERSGSENPMFEREESGGKAALQVGLFINCAGFAKIGNYARLSRTDGDRMIDVNCRAAVDTTLAVLPYMRAGDRIMEICSTAAFQPIQHMNLYAASKAFLYRYTRALRMELLPRGIIVTAVCPWWVKGTEFISVAQDNPANPDVKAAVKGFPVASKPERVAKRALRHSRIGLAVSTPGIMCFLHRMFCKLIPNKWMLYFWEFFRRLG